MNKFLILAAAFAAAPAMAQPVPEEVETTDTLPSAADIQEMTVMMDRMVGAFMDLPVGGLVAAVDPEQRALDHGQTVREMATRDDPHAEERMRSSLHAMTSQMGTMSQQLSVMVPVLSRTMEDFERRMEEAMRPLEDDLRD